MAFASTDTTLAIMKTPQNSIENFDPEEFPMRRPRYQSGTEILHKQNLEELKDMRCHLREQSSRHLLVAGALEEIMSQYNDVLHASFNDARIFYRMELEGIIDTVFAQKAEISLSYACHMSYPYLKARMQARQNKRLLNQSAAAGLARRRDELSDARELLHRQCIIDAFESSPLSWNADKYVRDGVRQGCFKTSDIIACDLCKHPDDSPDGVYRLRLAWVPSPEATWYPAQIYIDRINHETFDVENIEWAAYTGPREEWRWSDPRFEPRTTITMATIRCRYVAHEQCAERVARETGEMDEAAYKKSLPIWKRLFYKRSDGLDYFGSSP